METYYFVEELPLALEYGMSEDLFWNGDKDLLQAYQKAYVNRLHAQTHLQGLYNYLALSTMMQNLFRKNGEKAELYPSEDIFNPNKKFSNSSVSKAQKSLELNDEENVNRLLSAKERFLKERGN